MKLNYKLKNKKAVTRSNLESSSPNQALFYIEKGDLIKFKTSYSDKYDFASKIFKKENLKSVFKVQANTTNVVFTNIVIEDEPQFYEVITSNNTALTVQDIVLNSEFEVKELNGKVYTNDLIINYEISDGVFIYSSPIVRSSDISIKFYDRHISLSCPKANKTDTYFARPSTETVAEVSRVNDAKVEVPSFYISTRSSTIKVIEGDVVLHKKTEILPLEYNRLSPKDKLITTEAPFIEGGNNTLYSSVPYFTNEEVVLDYTAKFSSHIFEIDSELYFKIDKGLLTQSTSSDFDIKVSKIVDIDAISIHNNNFLNKNSFYIQANRYGLEFNNSLTDNYKRSLTYYITPKTITNPSKQIYFSTSSTTIYQENYSSFNVNKTPKIAILDLLDLDYDLRHPPLEKEDKVLLASINKAYYKEEDSIVLLP